jgi:16S rRNA (guanine966-N2)-methyltransferase
MATHRLRITGGSARGIPIVEPRGHRLRPTSGIVREALFNILADRCEGATVLDLFAGTGALGVEALSRGAKSAYFIESAASACQAILLTLARASVAERGTVLRGTLPQALKTLTTTFDIIFLDPPYGEPVAEETLVLLAPLLADGGIIVFEHGSRYNPPDRPGGLVCTDRRPYGDSALAFYAHMEGE